MCSPLRKDEWGRWCCGRGNDDKSCNRHDAHRCLACMPFGKCGQDGCKQASRHDDDNGYHDEWQALAA